MKKQLLYLTVFLSLIVITLFSFNNVSAQKQMENLNRGLVALYQGSSKVYVSWRLFGTDPSGISFNIYKSVGGATATKLNSAVITSTTDYVDSNVDITNSNAYYVKPVINGVEQTASEIFTIAANSPARQYIPIPLASVSNGTYNVGHVYVGDIDGDGDYDYIVKRFLESTTDRGVIVDCYLNTGEFKWRIYLGVNGETGNSPMTTPILVYDFNGDGKAEVLIKTGEGTTFGNGTTIGDTNGDGVTDYNTHVYTDLYQVTKDNCPEFLSLVNGLTGAEMARTNFIARGAKSTWPTWWGDNYGHRMNFIMASVAYLDGVHPSAVFSRGPGSKMDVVAWDLSGGTFSQRWTWTSRGKTFATGTSWVDFHQIKCVDVDGDGKDEISWGSGMLNDNGTVLYTTKLVHGDRFQIGDFDPNRAGLEVFAIQQNNPSLLGAALYDARTGTIMKEWYTSAVSDIGRGDVADVNSSVVGMELFSLASSALQSCTGTEVSAARPYPDLSVWWDGDLGREFFVGIGSGGYNPAINKWNQNTGSTDRLFTIYNDGGSYVVTSPYAGRAPFIGDILGDWREEIVLESSDHSTLRIYSTVNPASNRLYTLMHNPAYRIDVTTKGYLCSRYTDYYLGWGMSTPPAPNIRLVTPGSVALQATGGEGKVDLSWSFIDISLGTQEVLRDTDPDPAGRGRIAYVTNGATTYTDNTVTNGTTYYYWIKVTESDGNVVNSNTASATPQGCTPTAITPYLQVDGGSWQQASSATLNAGSTVKFGPQPVSGGSWSWSGPSGFSATAREVTISNIQTSQAGNYVATYTNSSGCQSTQTFVVTVNGGSSSIVVRARGSIGGEQIQLVAGGSTLATWTLTTSYQDYTATGSGTANVYFVNDNGSYDVQVDYIINNGTTYQAEEQATNTGVWSGTCGGSYSEWLHCNGYIQFGTAVKSALENLPLSGANDADIKIDMYPNPVKNELNLSIKDNADQVIRLQIYNTVGALIMTKEIVGNSSTVDMVNIPAGTYIAKISTSQKVITKMFVKE